MAAEYEDKTYSSWNHHRLDSHHCSLGLWRLQLWQVKYIHIISLSSVSLFICFPCFYYPLSKSLCCVNVCYFVPLDHGHWSVTFSRIVFGEGMLNGAYRHGQDCFGLFLNYKFAPYHVAFYSITSENIIGKQHFRMMIYALRMLVLSSA